MSRLAFRCLSCGREGPRVECFVPKPDELPAFEDRCPSCKRENIEIYDPRLRDHVERQQAQAALRRQAS